MVMIIHKVKGRGNQPFLPLFSIQVANEVPLHPPDVRIRKTFLAPCNVIGIHPAAECLEKPGGGEFDPLQTAGTTPRLSPAIEDIAGCCQAAAAFMVVAGKVGDETTV